MNEQELDQIYYELEEIEAILGILASIDYSAQVDQSF